MTNFRKLAVVVGSVGEAMEVAKVLSGLIGCKNGYLGLSNEDFKKFYVRYSVLNDDVDTYGLNNGDRYTRVSLLEFNNLVTGGEAVVLNAPPPEKPVPLTKKFMLNRNSTIMLTNAKGNRVAKITIGGGLHAVSLIKKNVTVEELRAIASNLEDLLNES